MMCSRCLFFLFLMIRRPPRSTRTDTLSLHDALPISIRVRARASAIALMAAMLAEGVRPSGQGSSITPMRSEEHTSELQSLMRISYAVFCLKKKTMHHQLVRIQNGLANAPLTVTNL